MSETPIRELPHILMVFRCGCRVNLAIEPEVARADIMGPPCGKHAKHPSVPVMSGLLPAKLVSIDFHMPHTPKPEAT